MRLLSRNDDGQLPREVQSEDQHQPPVGAEAQRSRTGRCQRKRSLPFGGDLEGAFDLARLSQNMLKGKELTEFVQRSINRL
ncbi:MAG: hypothetical protein WD077_03500 [Bacteroidia bacterium]